MSCRFKEYKLDEISLTIKTGKTPPASVREYLDKNEDGVNFIGSKSVFDGYIDKESIINLNKGSEPTLKNCSLEEDDILLNVTGDGITFGRNAIVEKNILPAYVSQNIAIIRLDKNIVYPKYLMYYLMQQEMKEYINGMSSGSARRAIPAKNIKEIKVSIPPLEEQKSIADILSTLDEKIELNNEMNKTLEEMAQAIFKRWFIDFEFLSGDGEPHKSSGGEMVESELGMIPRGWEVRTIEDITSVVSKGTTPTKKDMDTAQDDCTIKFIKVKDIDDLGNISINTVEKIPNSVHVGKLKRSILKEGDILFSIAGTIGRVATVDKRFDDSNANQAVAFIRLSEFERMFAYTLYFLKSEITQQEINANVVQAVQANASLGTIKALKFAMPSEELLIRYNSIIISNYNKQIYIKLENENLIGIRNGLLPKLISGELRVSDLDGVKADL